MTARRPSFRCWLSTAVSIFGWLVLAPSQSLSFATMEHKRDGGWPSSTARIPQQQQSSPWMMRRDSLRSLFAVPRGGKGKDDHPPKSFFSMNRQFTLSLAVTELALLTVAAQTGVLPALWDGQGFVVPYTTTWLVQDILLTLTTGFLATLLVQTITWGVERDKLNSRDARKLIHTLSAPLFLLFWPLFSPATFGARFFCAAIPVLNAVRLYRAAMVSQESSLGRAVSRSGNVREALGGPFIYVCIITLVVLFFWRTSAIGVVAVSTLAAGDGMADLVGRRFGRRKWPMSSDKSIVGTVAFWLASFFTAAGLIAWMQYWNCFSFPFDNTEMLIRLSFVCFLTGLVELAPGWDDNYTVPIASALLAMILLT